MINVSRHTYITQGMILETIILVELGVVQEEFLPHYFLDFIV